MFFGKQKLQSHSVQPEQPSVIKLGSHAVYPLCPTCKKEYREILILQNNEESELYGKSMVTVKMCPHCHTSLSVNWTD